MAFTKVYYDTRRQDQVQSSADDKGNVTQQVMMTWIAVSNDQTTTPLDAMTASAGGATVPQVGGTYTIAGQEGFYCNGSLPQRTSQSPFVFEIQLQFVRKFMLPQGSGDKWNIDISINGQKYVQTAYFDKDNQKIVNAAGDPFTDPALTKTYYDEVIDISYNTLNADSSVFAGLRGFVNSSACNFNIKGMSRTFDSRQLLCDEATMSTSITANDNTTPIWNVRIVLLVRQDKWQEVVLQQGYRELVGGVLTAILDPITRQPVSTPARLSDTGAHIGANANSVYTNTSSHPAFKIQGEGDLSPLFAGLG